MKKCGACGAKNRPKFEFCVRCSEPLTRPKRRGSIWPAGKYGFALSVVLALVVATMAFRSLATGTADITTDDPLSEATDERTDLESELVLDREAPDATHFEDTKASLRKGKDAFRAGDYEAALAHFERLARLSPNHPTAYVFAGLCQQKLGDDAAAIESFRRAVELQPDGELGRKALTRLLVDAGRLSEAETHQAWLVEEHPYEAGPRVELARIHRLQGRFDEAIEELQAAAENAPEDRRTLLELGIALNEGNRSSEAIDVFEKITADAPGDAQAQVGLGTAYLLDRQYEKAVEPLENAAESAPDDANVRFKLALAYENLDRIEDSLREYEAFVELSPEDPRASRVAELVERARAALRERSEN